MKENPKCTRKCEYNFKKTLGSGDWLYFIGAASIGNKSMYSISQIILNTILR